jgi:hypothetical protein
MKAFVSGNVAQSVRYQPQSDTSRAVRQQQSKSAYIFGAVRALRDMAPGLACRSPLQQPSRVIVKKLVERFQLVGMPY